VDSRAPAIMPAPLLGIKLARVFDKRVEDVFDLEEDD
jgi:DNA-binding XRE family transcriptional regulator